MTGGSNQLRVGPPHRLRSRGLQPETSLRVLQAGYPYPAFGSSQSPSHLLLSPHRPGSDRFSGSAICLTVRGCEGTMPTFL